MQSILMFSMILWVFLDRAKKLWAGLTWGKWLTTAAAVVTGLLLAIGYELDLLTALQLSQVQTTGGSILAGLAVAGGSSCIHELLQKGKAA